MVPLSSISFVHGPHGLSLSVCLPVSPVLFNTCTAMHIHAPPRTHTHTPVNDAFSSQELTLSRFPLSLDVVLAPRDLFPRVVKQGLCRVSKTTDLLPVTLFCHLYACPPPGIAVRSDWTSTHAGAVHTVSVLLPCPGSPSSPPLKSVTRDTGNGHCNRTQEPMGKGSSSLRR